MLWVINQRCTSPANLDGYMATWQGDILVQGISMIKKCAPVQPPAGHFFLTYSTWTFGIISLQHRGGGRPRRDDVIIWTSPRPSHHRRAPCPRLAALWPFLSGSSSEEPKPIKRESDGPAAACLLWNGNGEER